MGGESIVRARRQEIGITRKRKERLLGLKPLKLLNNRASEGTVGSLGASGTPRTLGTVGPGLGLGLGGGWFMLSCGVVWNYRNGA